MPTSLFGDAPVISRARAGLAHAWVQPKIANQLLRRLEALNIADGCRQRERHRHVDPGDCHQARDALVSQSAACEILLDDPEIDPQSIEFPQMPLDSSALIVRQDLFR